MNAPLRIRPEFPAKLAFLFDDVMPPDSPLIGLPGVQITAKPGQSIRYKVLHGGRGATKSWGVARTLLIRGARRKRRVLCVRELMASIDESVHFVISMQIGKLGMTGLWEITRNRIYCPSTGSEFIFKGLRHNVDEIKSLEDIDDVWVEEANNVSKTSWTTLIPTIRKAGSQIWVTFNPVLDTDETYQRFVAQPPSNAVVVKIGYEDNDWMSEEFKQEMADCRAKSEDDFMHIYGGFPKQVLDGAVYAEELRDALKGERITTVPYEHSKPVDTFWDLGYADMTAIWFVQKVGLQWRAIDFYENCGKKLEHYLLHLQGLNYVYGRHWMPHDAKNNHLGANKTIQVQAIEALGPKVLIVKKISIANGINASRTIFPSVWFDAVKCSDGIQHLRHYQFAVDPDTKKRSQNPQHDEHSHAADAFKSFSISVKEGAEEAPKPKPKERDKRYSRGLGWMA